VAQGTIKEYDEAAGVGSLLQDDRVEVAIDASSIGDPAIRTLRLGQRVRFERVEIDGRPVARGLALVTFD
jgi:cold shock CspA family protein